ncbi:MAG: hypothetical protein IPN87_06365 [Saprospiraceae bacterium]|nr:hypothetical protein [Candidatus Brachybacter algidus]
MFEGYPVSALITAQRFLTAKTATNGAQITGYCFDEDIDTVWPEVQVRWQSLLGLQVCSLKRLII